MEKIQTKEKKKLSKVELLNGIFEAVIPRRILLLQNISDEQKISNKKMLINVEDTFVKTANSFHNELI